MRQEAIEQQKEHATQQDNTLTVLINIPQWFTNEDSIITKAIYEVENKTQLIQYQVMNMLDEVGDIIHDDCRIKRRAIRRVLNKPEFKEKIAVKLLTLIKHR